MMQLQIGKIYTFNTTAPSVLNAIVKNATLLAIFGYAAAIQYDNIDLKYRQIYPLLPEGTPDSPESSIYYQFKTESGETIILADIWIQEATVVLVEAINAQITMNNLSLSDIPKIRDLLNAAGYTGFTIKQV